MNKQFVLPYSKNIGPGNTPHKDANNPIDQHAYEHDVAYSKAQSPSDIAQADKSFVSHVNDHIAEYISSPQIGNPIELFHGLVSSAGIQAKQMLESNLGPIYPSFSGNGTTQ